MDEILGPCCECGADCTEHDMVGNQIELGFPVLWCGNCINKHLDEDAAKGRKMPKFWKWVLLVLTVEVLVIWFVLP